MLRVALQDLRTAVGPTSHKKTVLFSVSFLQDIFLERVSIFLLEYFLPHNFVSLSKKIMLYHAADHYSSHYYHYTVLTNCGFKSVFSPSGL
jgi:hypothetical protein